MWVVGVEITRSKLVWEKLVSDIIAIDWRWRSLEVKLKIIIILVSAGDHSRQIKLVSDSAWWQEPSSRCVTTWFLSRLLQTQHRLFYLTVRSLSVALQILHAIALGRWASPSSPWRATILQPNRRTITVQKISLNVVCILIFNFDFQMLARKMGHLHHSGTVWKLGPWSRASNRSLWTWVVMRSCEPRCWARRFCQRLLPPVLCQAPTLWKMWGSRNYQTPTTAVFCGKWLSLEI